MMGAGSGGRGDTPITGVTASAYRIPTDAPESDGTLEWNSTTMVLVEFAAGDKTGQAYTYGHAAIAQIVRDTLADVLAGIDATATGQCWHTMLRAVRNQGQSGLSSMAVAAVDAALWDLKGRLLEASLVTMLGSARRAVMAYGSGGFTSYSDDRLRQQLGGWAADGFGAVKMKIGREATRDPQRIAAAREAIGENVALMIDANGAYSRKQALTLAEAVEDQRVSWFEEPVSSEDLAGLRLLRDRVPPPIEVAAGEYGYDLRYFRRMLEAEAVDVLQADATRCAGITGFMAVDALCQAFEVPLSAHCAPALHCQPCCAAQSARHVEAFHDHLRIEGMLFDGGPDIRNGRLVPDTERPDLGLEFKHRDAERFAL
jgi:L-alanine-DL-glutamate epimerase-like enolase superfamily enzyme